MNLDLAEQDLKKGLLGLVVALVETIVETLKLQALRRVEGGSLTEAEVERLGDALMDLDQVLEELKVELGIGEAVHAIRRSLDQAVDDAVNTIIAPYQGGNTVQGVRYGHDQ